jgi:rare lipoprotein A
MPLDIKAYEGKDIRKTHWHASCAPEALHFANKAPTAIPRETGEKSMPKTRLLYLVVAVYTVLMFYHAQSAAERRYAEKGLASWYGKRFAGRPTASGELFSPKEMTAAHRTLPLGTKVLVTNLETGAQTEVKINDRGPYADPKRRIIDLSRAAADSLDLVERGIGQVQVAATEPPAKAQAPHQELLYAVQVGIFEEYAEAQWVLGQLQERYSTVYIDPRQGPSGPYYRVRIGPFETEKRAEKVAKGLKQDGHAIFVDEIPAPYQPSYDSYARREEP